MNARSALFDVFGDHLRERGGAATIAALVRLLAALDISAAAVRTSVSRMVRQGWLQAVRLPGGPGYALTPRGRTRLNQAAERIFRTRVNDWDGQWHLVVVEHVADRGRRDRVRSALGFLGYAALADDTWIAARPSAEVGATLAGEQVTYRAFSAATDDEPATLAARAWDLDGLAARYADWLDRPELVADPSALDDEASFAARARLLHEWRKFLFTDPGLPRELLPADWPGDRAAAAFDETAASLAPGADRFVDECLGIVSTHDRSSA